MYIYQLEQDRDWSEFQALLKIYEEVDELLVAFDEEGDDNILEEGFDVIQTVLSFFEVKGFTAKEIAAGFEKHNEKLENRGWDRRAVWEVKDVE